MSDVLWQGLMISVMGMGLTFLALGLLILTMILLERFSRSSVEPPVPDGTAPKEEPSSGVPTQNTEDEEIAAAIAVALARKRSLNVGQGSLGATLEVGPGAWWTLGRSQQQSSNASRAIQWRD